MITICTHEHEFCPKEIIFTKFLLKLSLHLSTFPFFARVSGFLYKTFTELSNLYVHCYGLEKYKFDLVVYTQDWHPSDHCSFITNVDKYEIHICSKKTAENVEVFEQVVYDGDPVLVQEIWPPHCIQGSHGAKFHKDLNVSFLCMDKISVLANICRY